MKSVAEYLHIKPSSVTPVIDNLVKRGDIKRMQAKNDRRVVYVELTLQRSKLLKKTYKNIQKTIGKLFSKLNDEDKKILVNILGKI